MKLKYILENKESTYYACIMCAMILPVYVHWLPPIMVLWGLFWILENRSGFREVPFYGNRSATLLILFLVLFIWQIAGLFFADSLYSGIERISKRLSFLLFPMVLFYPGEKIVKNINLIIRIFAIFTFLYIIYCFSNALHNSLIIHDGRWTFNAHPSDIDYENYFYGYRFSHNIHPSYLAMYVLLSIVISLESLLDRSLNVIKRSMWITISVFFLIVLYLVSSRAGVLAAMIVLPLYIFLKLYSRIPKWSLLIVIVILAAFLVIVVKTNERIYLSVEEISDKKIDEILSKDIRLLIWKSAIGVIKENPVLGVGTGDASEELKKEFNKRGYVNGFYENLNAHNQYLEILLENGIVGLVIFLIILGYLSFMAVSQNNLILGLFIIIMAIFFLFETVLNRLAGITFFPFFSFLLTYIRSSKTT
jgi:O-antigen ligase